MTNGYGLQNDLFFFHPALSDFTTQTRSLVFNGTTDSQTVTIPIQDDMVVENQFEFFSINLNTSDSAVMLDPVSATVTVEDNDSEFIFTAYKSLHIHQNVNFFNSHFSGYNWIQWELFSA